MGLETYMDSDNAADFHWSVKKQLKNVGKTVKLFETELKDEANCYNTPGWVNIALVIEDGILDSLSNKNKKKFVDVISASIAKLDIMIDENKNDTDQNVIFHVNAYKRMSNSLSNFIKEV
jgi:hypothetical protein